MLHPGPARRVKVCGAYGGWLGGGCVEGYFQEKSVRKSVKSRQNLFFSLGKTEKF